MGQQRSKINAEEFGRIVADYFHGERIYPNAQCYRTLRKSEVIKLCRSVDLDDDGDLSLQLLNMDRRMRSSALGCVYGVMGGKRVAYNFFIDRKRRLWLLDVVTGKISNYVLEQVELLLI